jgi:hypothetical protein
LLIVFAKRNRRKFQFAVSIFYFSFFFSHKTWKAKMSDDDYYDEEFEEDDIDKANLCSTPNRKIHLSEQEKNEISDNKVVENNSRASTSYSTKPPSATAHSTPREQSLHNGENQIVDLDSYMKNLLASPRLNSASHSQEKKTIETHEEEDQDVLLGFLPNKESKEQLILQQKLLTPGE